MRGTLLRAIALTIALAYCAGCGMGDHMANMDETTKTLTQHTDRMATQLESDREQILTLAEQMKSLTDSMKILATALVALQQSASSLIDAIMQQLKTTEPGKSPDIDDVLTPPPAGASGASGTSGATG